MVIKKNEYSLKEKYLLQNTLKRSQFSLQNSGNSWQCAVHDSGWLNFWLEPASGILLSLCTNKYQ